jgi:FKBP-type peptidyl-prolyl cis-trans isomerase 2
MYFDICFVFSHIDDITVNFNHPLAGCDVSFQVEILEKSKSPQ